MQKCLNLILGFDNSIFVLSFLIIAFVKKMCVVLIDLGVWFLNQACSHLVYIFKDFNIFSLLHFQRFQCLQSFTFSKTSMSSVLHIFKDFNVSSLLHFSKTSRSSMFYICKISMSALFYAFRDFSVFSFALSKTAMSFVLHFFKDFNVLFLFRFCFFVFSNIWLKRWIVRVKLVSLFLTKDK